MKTEKIKVLIVDDSALMRLILEDMLSYEEDIEIVGKARNGLDAIEKVKKLAPHVVTLDIEMPVMDGITALRGILEANPTVKVIMFSTLTKRGADATIKCLELGAFDFVHKPSQSDKDEIQTVKTDLITKIRSAFMSLCSDKTLKLDQTYPKKVSKVPDEKGDYNLLLVASSTGGPQALMKLLPQLPKNFPAPIAIVQHMPPGFTKSFSSRLDQLCNIHVVEGSENTPMTGRTTHDNKGNPREDALPFGQPSPSQWGETRSGRFVSKRFAVGKRKTCNRNIDGYGKGRSQRCVAPKRRKKLLRDSRKPRDGGYIRHAQGRRRGGSRRYIFTFGPNSPKNNKPVPVVLEVLTFEKTSRGPTERNS